MPHQLLKTSKLKSGRARLIWPVLVFAFFTLLTTFIHSAPSKASLLDYLTQEKAHLLASIKLFNQEVLPSNGAEYKIKTQKTLSMEAMNKAKIQSLEGFLESQKKQQLILSQRLNHLQQLPLNSPEKNIQERVAEVEQLLDTNKKTIVLIQDNLILAKNFDLILVEKIKSLDVWKKHDDLDQKIAAIKTHKKSLEQKLNQLYQLNSNQVSLKEPENGIQTQKEVQLLLNQQKIALIHLKINALSVEKKTTKAKIEQLYHTDTKSLQNLSEQYKEAVKNYANLEQLLGQMLHSLQEEAKVLSTSKEAQVLNSLQDSLDKELYEVKVQKLASIDHLDELQEQLKKQLSSHQSLAEYNRDTLPLIFNKLVHIPSLFYKYLRTLALKVYDSYSWLNPFAKGLTWIIPALFIIGFFLLNRFLKSLSKDKERFRLTAYLYDGLLTLIQKNTPFLCFWMILASVFYLTHIPYSNVQLLFNLLLIWITFRSLLLIARLALLERISDSSGKDVTLYYRLKWLLLFGGWVTALMVFSHVLPLTPLLQDIFNRLFMLFLLTVSIVAWNSKDVIPYLLRPLLKYKKRYFKKAIALLVTLVPITLFTTAIIGLSGFINLAWTMSLYQAYLLLVLVGYILVRGLVFDALEFVSEWMISSLKNGWLWTEVLLKPLDKILRIILFLSSFLLLFQLYGWHSDSLVMLSLARVAQYSIVNLTGVHITVASTIEFFILLALFVWASKWTREFSYRWLYQNAKDAGIRNSLSVFTQYAIILLGTFIAFHVLGLDFSGMSMILGGLAVGMGFGLRDFASNIIGGIMLLIERPVREGDLITLGEYEGKVAHIGIRSMRVSSWDNMEVLIPNAETFNKPFTNWTHQDSIVRTVVPIKVSRADDPVKVQQLILDVLAIIPEVLSDPPPQVFLGKIDTALIEFEVRYFINVALYTRFEVRSKVLFAITAQFKAAGVKAPIDCINVEIAEGQNESTKNSSN